MACKQNCTSSESVFTFSAGAGTYQLSVWPEDGDAIIYATDETSVDRKIDSEGDFYLSGHSWVMRNPTFRAYCTDEAIALDAAWISNGPLEMCGSGNVITNCCSGGYTYKSIRLVSVTAPPIGDSVGEYEFEFEGVLG